MYLRTTPAEVPMKKRFHQVGKHPAKLSNDHLGIFEPAAGGAEGHTNDSPNAAWA